MRISVNKYDPGYQNRHNRCNVFLNGKKISQVITADEEMGFILKHKERDGCLVISKSKNEIVKETLFGKVVLKKKPAKTFFSIPGAIKIKET